RAVAASGVLAPECVEDGGLQPREAEREPVLVPVRARQRISRRVPTPRGALDAGTAGVAEAEQAGDLVERLAGRVVGRAAEDLGIDRPPAEVKARVAARDD